MTQSNIDKLKQAKRALHMAREALGDVCIRTPLGQDEDALPFIGMARNNADVAYGYIVVALAHVKEVPSND